MGMVKPPLLVGKNISSGRKRIYPSWLGHRCTQDRRLHRSRISRRESICRRRPSARASPLAQLPFARFTDLAQIEGFLGDRPYRPLQVGKQQILTGRHPFGFVPR